MREPWGAGHTQRGYEYEDITAEIEERALNIVRPFPAADHEVHRIQP